MAAAAKAKFAQGSDEALLTKQLDSLTSGNVTAGWSLTSNGQGIERSFKFKTFAKTWVSSCLLLLLLTLLYPVPALTSHGTRSLFQDFMTAVSLKCKLKNHHPEWSNVRVSLLPPNTGW